jgi:predicted phage terminase large subunit-like protein
VEKLRRAAEGSLAEFIKQGWHVLEPTTPLVWNWHLDVLCAHMEAVLDGRIRRLVINVPPGTMKSLVTNVFGPAWKWLKQPSWRAMYISGNPRVAFRDSVKCRDLLTSSWYQETFKPTWSFSEDVNAKGLFKNTATGFRQAVSAGQKITGDRADAIFVDDPNDASEVQSKAMRDAVLEWWDLAAANRLNDLVTGTICIIMQRLHEQDLSGHVLKDASVEHLCLPMEFETADPDRSRTSLRFIDPRGTDGALLFPQRFPATVLAAEKRRLGSSGYAGQHQQRPVPAEGAMFKRDWFNRRWRRPGEPEIEGLESRLLPERFDELILVVDAAFKGVKDSDRVCIGKVGRLGPDKFLLAVWWDQMGFPATVRTIIDARSAHPVTTTTIIEDKANGPAVIEVLKVKVPGVIPVEPEGGKEARAAAVAPDIEAGNWWIPQSAPWVGDYVSEMIGFPRAAYDDAVDMTSYALRRLSETSPAARLKRALGVM